jgi:hypothetical protein
MPFVLSRDLYLVAGIKLAPVLSLSSGQNIICLGKNLFPQKYDELNELRFPSKLTFLLKINDLIVSYLVY